MDHFPIVQWEIMMWLMSLEANLDSISDDLLRMQAWKQTNWEKVLEHFQSSSPTCHTLLSEMLCLHNKLMNPGCPPLLSPGFEAPHSGQAIDNVGKLADSAAQADEFRHRTEAFCASVSLSLKWE